MNNRAPDFEMDDTIPTSSSSSHCSRRPKSLAIQEGEEDVMELLWQNGPVVAHRSLRRSQPVQFLRDDQAQVQVHQQQQQQQQHAFMGEDEMASWLHYHLNDANFDDTDFSSHLLYPTPPSSSIHPPESSYCPVLSHRDSAVVDSSLTPAAAISSVGASSGYIAASGGAMAAGRGVSVSDTANIEVTTTTCEMTLTSSPGGSSSSAKPPAEDRKRKGKEEERDSECQSEVN